MGQRASGKDVEHEAPANEGISSLLIPAVLLTMPRQNQLI
jgi:hypothetical protein